LPESKHQQVEGLPFTETHKRTKVLHNFFLHKLLLNRNGHHPLIAVMPTGKQTYSTVKIYYLTEPQVRRLGYFCTGSHDFLSSGIDVVLGYLNV